MKTMDATKTKNSFAVFRWEFLLPSAPELPKAKSIQAASAA
jgi:hypothetical protein